MKTLNYTKNRNLVTVNYGDMKIDGWLQYRDDGISYVGYYVSFNLPYYDTFEVFLRTDEEKKAVIKAVKKIVEYVDYYL